GADLQTVARVYAAIIDKLGINSLLSIAKQTQSTDKFENELLIASLEDIKVSIAQITAHLLDTGVTDVVAVSQWLGSSKHFLAFENLVSDLQEKPATPAGIAVVARHLLHFA